MSKIEFSNIIEDRVASFSSFFELVKGLKITCDFDEAVFLSALPEYAKKNFSRLELNEPVDERWDLLSWYDALKCCAIDFKELIILRDGTGALIFDEVSWPSGGLEATEQMVIAFGGTIVSNDAI